MHLRRVKYALRACFDNIWGRAIYICLARKGLGPLTGDGLSNKYIIPPIRRILKGHCPLSRVQRQSLWQGSGGRAPGRRKLMKLVLGCMRRADEDFRMINEGDKVCVGVSGGKDSLVLLYAMSLYRHFCKNSFELTAVTLDMGLEKTDWSPVVELCERINVPYEVRITDIGDVIFNQRKEPNPCALCSKMRRGALTDYCKEIGANKLALGHHRDDAIETLAMSLLFEGRLHTFHPVTHLSRQNITQIRPMAYLPEKDIIRAARKFELPVTKSPCSV